MEKKNLQYPLALYY